MPLPDDLLRHQLIHGVVGPVDHLSLQAVRVQHSAPINALKNANVVNLSYHFSLKFLNMRTMF